MELLNRLKVKAYRLDLEGWLRNELFSLDWWVLVVFLISPWILWFFLADSSKVIKTTLFGTLVVNPTTYIDAAGIDLEFWRYPVQLLPFAPRAISFDMSMVPVAFMILHQYFEGWRAFIIALVVTAAVYVILLLVL
ncbi:CBO0543 family protein [Cytobacillus firmus]|uniref:CBO0543 family protein n=1 Tax=Cytobacillus firmus TaxID=1399 RepID=UPI0036AFC767